MALITNTIKTDIFVKRRLKTIPLPNHLKFDYVKLFSKWQGNSGDDWAIERAKGLKDCILNSFASKNLSHKPQWFACTRSGKLKGIPGKLWNVAMSSEKNLTAVLNLINCYTLISHNQSDVDVTAIGRSIMTEDNAKRILLDGEIQKALKTLNLYKTVSCAPPVPLLQVLPGKQSHSEMIPWDIYYIFKGWYGVKYREYLERCVGGEVDYFYDSKYDYCLDEYDFSYNQNITYIAQPDMTKAVGYVHITTGPGGKDRYFASPNQVIQRGLEPLKYSLGEVVKNLPWDCTFSQRKADHIIMQKLNQGTVYSVDLSKATDNFPWYFQKEVLRNLLRFSGRRGDDTYVSWKLLDDCITQGIWTLEADTRIYPGTRWRKGQPLGMAPSFFTFTLSHGLLLYILNGYKHDQDFYVLGDDVIIFNKQLHDAYRAVLHLWQLPISEAKSFASDRLAQFAGVTYTRNTCRWIPKWNPVTKQNILDISAWWYPGLTKGLKDDDLIQQILSLPQPYGIGRNPDGKSLDERFPDSLVEILQDEVEKAMPSNTLINPNRLFSLAYVGMDYIYDTVQAIHVKHEYTSRNPNRISIFGESVLSIVDGTEVPGFPSQRLRWCDPYSLGPIAHWKKVFSKYANKDQA